MNNEMREPQIEELYNQNIPVIMDMKKHLKKDRIYLADLNSIEIGYGINKLVKKNLFSRVYEGQLYKENEVDVTAQFKFGILGVARLYDFPSSVSATDYSEVKKVIYKELKSNSKGLRNRIVSRFISLVVAIVMEIIGAGLVAYNSLYYMNTHNSVSLYIIAAAVVIMITTVGFQINLYRK